jgi:23S rRNA pseudouridine2457 synthase
MLNKPKPSNTKLQRKIPIFSVGEDKEEVANKHFPQKSILQYYAIYKPFQMLCQFSPEGDKQTLANFNFTFSKDIYPVGRLDYDSEGLLILSNDKGLNNLLLNPKKKHKRQYWVQIEGIPTSDFFNKMGRGVSISIDGQIHKTLPAQCRLLSDDEIKIIPERNPPIRFRKNISDTWVALTLTEGKNRQVRKMTAACGFPTLRLIRYSIEILHLPIFMPN